jgi:hypothetical protein
VSLSARTIVLIAALLPSAAATTITILPATNIAQATAERNSWLTETFGAGTTANPVRVDIDNITPGKSEVEVLQLLTSLHSLYFFLTAVEGNIQIRTADGTTALIHDGDDGLYFIGITSTTAIGSIQWRSQDGLELYDFGTPRAPNTTPEPATSLSILAGLVLIMRRCRAPSAPSPIAPWILRSAKLARRLRGAPGPGNRARP